MLSLVSKKLLFISCLVGLAVALLANCGQRNAPPTVNGSSSSSNSHGRISPELAADIARIEKREQGIRETVWAKEILAQKCGQRFETLWDSLNASTNKWTVVRQCSLGEIILPGQNSPQVLPHRIELREPTGPGRACSPSEWQQLIGELESAGWTIIQAEFRHNRFDTDESGQPRQSTFYFSAHLNNERTSERAVVEGDIVVGWSPRENVDEPIGVRRIDASGVAIKSRKGEPVFKSILSEQIAPRQNSRAIDPLIVYDLNGDGLSEIILAGQNLVYRRHGESYRAEPLCKDSPGAMDTSVLADFDGDGAADFLCFKYEGLFLFSGATNGTFEAHGRTAAARRADWKSPVALTCGDVDHDGDLDLFMAQYREPYEGGALPTPFHDARNGHPAYLLLNDGRGNFVEATEAAGLAPKRGRRSYSASLADLNDDGHLDLMVVSDFAGVDLYKNDGKGHFTDVTEQWVSDPRGFGMAHAIADFNVDGRLDFLMTGMTSPTAERLDHLRLWREDGEDRMMRSRMTFGNRLYLGRPEGGFKQSGFSDSIARSGWSWGCGVFDFDNDGFSDVYIANGLESNRSVRDYESEYWLHDKYVGRAIEEPAHYLYFKEKFARTRGRDFSYGGYEKNRFYLNQRGRSFLEAGYLMGIALEQDSRNVVANDLDGDGRVDLVVTTLEIWPEAKQTVTIYRNVIEDGGNWIGFRFREEIGGESPVGVKVKLRYGDQTTVRQLVTGDSYRSQHSDEIHFGLGATDRVESAEIRWVNGAAMTLGDLGVNRYHVVPAARKSTVGSVR
jgi:enediyne biosynthesis protein E4